MATTKQRTPTKGTEDDSSDCYSSASDISQPGSPDGSYSASSDGEIMLSSGKTFEDQPTHSNQSDDRDPKFPAFSLTDDDCRKIEGILSIKKGRTGLHIFPGSVGKYLKKSHKNIVNNLEKLGGIALSAQSLMEVIGKAPEKAPGVIADVCVLSDTKPVLILTFQEHLEQQDYYNSQLAMHFEEFVVHETGINISAVHGVIEAGATTTFGETLEELEREADMLSFPQALEMTSERNNIITRAVIELLKARHVGIPSNPGPSTAKRPKKVDYRKEDPIMQLFRAARDEDTNTLGTLLHQGYASAVDEENNNILHLVCMFDIQNHIDAIEKIVNFDITGMDSLGEYRRTPLMTAARYGEIKLFDLLVGKGFRVLGEKNNVLHFACLGGHEDMVDHILSKGLVEQESRGEYGRTPLLVAAEFGRVNVFDLLRSRNCDVTAVDHFNNNVLHVACIGGRLDMAEHILDLSIVDTESRGQYGRTALLIAARFGHTTLCSYLLKKSVSLKAVDKQNNNILHLSCIGGNIDTVMLILIQNITTKESTGQFGRTPLMFAARHGHRELFDFLVRQGCDVKVVDDHNNTILHVACLGGHVEMVKRILSLNIVDKETRGRYGQTPLMIAASKGHKRLYGYLVSIGCDEAEIDEKSPLLT